MFEKSGIYFVLWIRSFLNYYKMIVLLMIEELQSFKVWYHWMDVACNMGEHDNEFWLTF
jgi:hypothetical protein